MTIRNVWIEGEVAMKHRVMIRDLSPFGLRLSTNVAYRIGARVRLRIPMEGRDFTVNGTVKNRCEGDPESGHHYAYGIQFSEVSTAVRRFLNRANFRTTLLAA